MIQGTPNKQFRGLCSVLFLVLVSLAGYVTSEVYNLRPSPSDPCNTEHCLTLSQLVNNISDYLKNDTTLIFGSGNHTIESDTVIEHINSFSMLYESTSSPKAIIVCSHQGRFEFRNAHVVIVRNIDFLGCTRNKIVSVSRFMVEDLYFHGHGEASDSTLIMSETSAILHRVTFINNHLQLAIRNSAEDSNKQFKVASEIILCNRSDIIITQAVFQENSVQGGGAIIHGMKDSEITIFNTTFVNNHKINFHDDNNTYTQGRSGAILYIDYSTSMKVYNTNFERNKGSVIIAFGVTTITHSFFANNTAMYMYGYSVISVWDTNLTISGSPFLNNTGQVLEAWYTNANISNTDFTSNHGGVLRIHYGETVVIHHCSFTENGNHYYYHNDIVYAWNTNIMISHSEFVKNNATLLNLIGSVVASISHSEFVSNSAFYGLVYVNVNQTRMVQSKFANNSAYNLVILYGNQMNIKLSEFVNNRADFGVVNVPYHSTAVNIDRNRFIDNSAAYDIYISSDCKPGYSLSLGSSRCIQCPTKWRQNLIGLIIAATVAGIFMVIFVLALNMTVAIGTLNGILFYANIVAINADIYFHPFSTPNFVTVFISWLNLDIGFDVCFFDGMDDSNKALIQLAFPAYIIFLVIIVIIISEYSSKFAKIIGKHNPVAALATMILFSYTKFFSGIFSSVHLLYLHPAYGSRNLDVSKLSGQVAILKKDYALLIFAPIVFLLGVLYVALIFSWQCLLQHQSRTIFKWVKYQKLHHFIEPYHTPFMSRYRYWTGLLLLVRILLLLISVLNFTRDPWLNLVSTIFVIGFLLLVKGIIAKRIYRSWILDVLETSIYFNLVIFSAVTLYTLESEGKQMGIAYTSVMLIFIPFLVVIIVHVLRYTKLYKSFIVREAFKWISSVVTEKKKEQNGSNDVPEELDGYQLERASAQDLPAVTYSEVEVSHPISEYSLYT